MTWTGRVQQGVVVLDDPTQLPGRARVSVALVDETEVEGSPLRRLLRFAGKAEGLPADASRRLDAYLYERPEE